MFERAATKTEPGPLRAERLYLAAVMYFYAHSIKRALDLLAEAQANAGDDQARTRYTILHLALSYYADARTAAAALVGEARRLADVDPKHAAFAAGFAACFRAHLRGEEGALEAAELARELARGVTEDAALFATVAAGTGFVAAGCPGEAIGLRDAATEIFRAREWRYDEPAEWARGYAGVYAAYALLVLGEHGVLRERVAALAAEFVPGDEVSLMLALVIAGTAEFFAGHWSEAQAAIGRSLHLAGEINWRGPQVLESRRVLEHIAASQGAPVSTAAKRDAPIEWASLIAAGSGGLLLLGRGDYAEAAQHYETQVLTDVGPLVLYYDVADAIEAYIRAGRREEAADWLDRFSAQARESGWPWALALTAHLEALAAAAPDDEARFLTALEWAERAAQPFLQARTQLAYGDRLRRAGRRREARDLLRAALATFERLDARPWADQAAAQLRATGERVQMSQPPDVGQLTPQELQVALVVARGATNKEAAAHLFLSPKTIEKHLGGVYSKLGVRGRADLVRVFPAVEAQAPAVTEPA